VQTVRIALVGDYSAAIIAHQAINESMRMASGRRSIEAQWLHTAKLQPRDTQALDCFHGLWCAPGSPYANTEGVFWAIEWARTRNVPFLGTCGGFQHAVLEYVRHVLGRDQAAHAELEPDAAFPLIAALACALVEKSERIVPTGRGRFTQWYGAMPRTEDFHCSFGLNPAYEALLENSGLEVVACGDSGEVRAVELSWHPFFVGTLFQPERSALRGEMHPLVDAFIQAAIERASSGALNSSGCRPG